MSTFDNAVSINPYFQITDQNMAAAKDFLAQFCDLVSKNEPGCLFYNFTFKGNELCCREAYKNADAVKAHFDNCGPALGEFMKIAELSRIEVHGPTAELEQLKEAFAAFNPDYYVSECGIGN
jgi:quinol monooxygenase YgiN